MGTLVRFYRGTIFVSLLEVGERGLRDVFCGSGSSLSGEGVVYVL